MAPEQNITVGSDSGLGDSVAYGSEPVGSHEAAAAPAASDTSPKQRFIAYGEMVEVDEHDGSRVMIEQPYPEPRIVDELAPNQRGNLLPPE